MYSNGFLVSENITIAGQVFRRDSSTIVMTCDVQSGNYSTFRAANAAYVVPTGYKLVYKALKIVNYSTTIATCVLGYGDNIKSNSTAPTNFISNTGNVSDGLSGNVGATQYSSNETIISDFEAPTGKYPACQVNGTTALVILVAKLVKI